MRVKSIKIQSLFWSVFSCFLSEYRKTRTRKISVFGHFSRSVNLRIQSEYRKVRTRKSPVFEQFSRSVGELKNSKIRQTNKTFVTIALSHCGIWNTQKMQDIPELHSKRSLRSNIFQLCPNSFI